MSHLIEGTTTIHSLPALRHAAETLGLDYQEGSVHHRWFETENQDSRTVTPDCLATISVPEQPSAYNIGVYSRPDGNGMELRFDDYGERGRTLMNAVGARAGVLQDAYVETVFRRRYAGTHRIRSRRDEHNNLVLEAVAS